MKIILCLLTLLFNVQIYGQVLNNKDSVAFVKETLKKKLRTHPKLEKKEDWKLDTVIVLELNLLTRKPEEVQKGVEKEHEEHDHKHEMNTSEYIQYIHYNIIEKMRMILVGRAENFKYPGEGVAIIEKMLVD